MQLHKSLCALPKSNFKYLGFGFASVCLMGWAMFLQPIPTFVWNVTPSVPTGLYIVRPRPIVKGDIAAVALPKAVADFAHERRYLPRDVPALKVVFATAGDMVCRKGTIISVNGTIVATAKLADPQLRPMPTWHGCYLLRQSEVFLLNSHPDSFDSRYFGVVDASHLIGHALRL